MHLPIWKTTLDIFDYCWNERATALRFGAVPVLIVFLCAAGARLLQIDPNTFWKTHPLAGALLLIALPTLAYLPVTVAWYRRVVIGPDGVAGRPLFVLGRLEWRVLAWQVLISLLLVAALAIIGSVAAAVAFGVAYFIGQVVGVIVGGVLGIGVIVAFVAAACRLSLVTAMAATDHAVGPKRAWRMTKGLGLRMAAIVVLTLLAAVLAWAMVKILAFLLGVALGLVSPAAMEQIVAYITLAGETVTGLLAFLLTATLFGFVYRGLETEPPADITGTPPAAPAP